MAILRCINNCRYATTEREYAILKIEDDMYRTRLLEHVSIFAFAGNTSGVERGAKTVMTRMKADFAPYWFAYEKAVSEIIDKYRRIAVRINSAKKKPF